MTLSGSSDVLEALVLGEAPGAWGVGSGRLGQTARVASPDPPGATPPFQLFRDGQALILPNPLLDQNPPKNLGGRLLERRMGLAGMTGLLHVVLSACPGVSSFSLRGPDSLGRPCPHPIHTLTKRRPCRKIVGTAPRQLPAPGMRLSWENPWLLPKALPRGKAPPWAR